MVIASDPQIPLDQIPRDMLQGIIDQGEIVLKYNHPDGTIHGIFLRTLPVRPLRVL